MVDAAELVDFATRWNLDSRDLDYLSSLDEGVRRTILTEFAPREGTHDVAGKLKAFARSVVAQQQPKGPAMSPELDAFAQRWGLDSAAYAWLEGLPPAVSAILVEQFDPKEDTQNVIGKLRGFARSIQQRIPATGARVADHQMHHLPSTSTQVAEFCAKWGADDSAVSLLRKLPAQVQQTVMEQFDPKGDTVNVTGKLCAFARSIAAGRQVQGVIETFAQHWGLDPMTTQFLHELPQDVRETVIREFDPKQGTKDVGGRLRMFARGILAKQGGGSERVQPEPTPYRGQRVERAPVVTYLAPAPETYQTPESGSLDSALAAGAAEAQAAAATTTDPAVAEFVVRWSLDASCVQLLESLPDDSRAKVIEEFDPRGNTRNVIGKLRAFANTVVSGTGRSQSAAAAPSAVERYAAPAHQPLFGGAAAHGGADASEEMAFLDRWGLSANPSALDVLRRLHPPVRARVMAEFAPKEDTQDVFGKFCGFAASVAKGASKGGAASAPPPLRVPSLHGPSAGGYGTGRGGGGPVAMARPALVVPSSAPWHGRSRSAPAGGMTPEQFADKWQLDAGSRALLSGLDPAAQAAVIVEFQPRGDTRDTSGKFCAFARSVAARLQPTTGQKRALSGGHSFGPPTSRPRY